MKLLTEDQITRLQETMMERTLLKHRELMRRQNINNEELLAVLIGSMTIEAVSLVLKEIQD
ncbi:hypothetical protein [Paenibacillus koleovorans]|uniref:hypothetical protein n=1 Tax=Paenibacillus koleovorans TaxID=121608 RepID=UPI000FD812B0|nr:hypothetical protein [Paenibacillus koleovorans]